MYQATYLLQQRDSSILTIPASDWRQFSDINISRGVDGSLVTTLLQIYLAKHREIDTCLTDSFSRTTRATWKSWHQKG